MVDVHTGHRYGTPGAYVGNRLGQDDRGVQDLLAELMITVSSWFYLETKMNSKSSEDLGRESYMSPWLWLRGLQVLAQRRMSRICSDCFADRIRVERLMAKSPGISIVIVSKHDDQRLLEYCREYYARILPSDADIAAITIRPTLKSVVKLLVDHNSLLDSVCNPRGLTNVVISLELPFRPLHILTHLFLRWRLKALDTVCYSPGCGFTNRPIRCAPVHFIRRRRVWLRTASLSFTSLCVWLLTRVGLAAARPPNVKTGLLVILCGNLGDIVVASVGLRALRRCYPDAHIVIVVDHESGEELLRQCPYANEVLTAPRKVAINRQLRLWARLAAYRFTFSVCLHPECNITLEPIVHVPRALGIPRRFGSVKLDDYYLPLAQPYSDPVVVPLHQSIVSYVVAVAKAAGADAIDTKTECWVSTDSRRSIEQFLATGDPKAVVIVVHPGATQKFKRWPPQYYAELIISMKTIYRARILITGTAEEADLAEEILSVSGSLAESVVGKFSVSEMLALIERCDVLITNDTGPMHFAIALNTPTVAIFGPTDPRHIVGDDRPTCRLLRGSPDCPPRKMCSIYAQANDHRKRILAACCQQGGDVCTDAVRVSDVLAALGEVLNEASSEHSWDLISECPRDDQTKISNAKVY